MLQLNFDKELGLIGLSNALTGIVGAGFTGEATHLNALLYPKRIIGTVLH
jgi:predicted ABC-class ATPase